MRWVCLPQSFRSPDVFDLTGVWHTDDRTGGLYALHFAGAVVIVEDANFFPGLKIGSDELSLRPTLYCGHNWWSGDGWKVFRSIVSGLWIATNELGTNPREPVEGDAWYSSVSIPVSPEAAVSPSASFSPQGTATRAIAAQMYWPRWRKGGQASSDDYCTPLGGEYAPIDGASGTLLLGTPAWRRDTDGAVFQHRSSGVISKFENIFASFRDRIVPVTDFDPDDVSGDFCFYGNRTLRLREFPEDGSDADLFTLDEESGDYTPAGHFVSLGERVVPYVPARYVPAASIYSATVSQWM